MLRLVNITVDLGKFILNDISLHVPQGAYTIVLGPTGTGKTVLLETIAGIHRPNKGNIYINGKESTDLPPETRKLGVVYQDYALFPHLTVYENIAFGLRLGKESRIDIQHTVKKMAEFLDIKSLLERRPANLSGGEKQRVALARALALKPYVLLLDEPLSALDRHTRDRLRRELKRVHKETGLTIFHITHDLAEAFFLADQLVVMQNGIILQQGKPDEILKTPTNRSVAKLVGIHNLIEAKIQQYGFETRLGIFNIPVSYRDITEGNNCVYLAIPDWCVELTPEREKNLYGWQGEMRLTDINFMDGQVELELIHNNGERIRTSLSRREFANMAELIRPGKKIRIGIWKDAISCIHK